MMKFFIFSKLLQRLAIVLIVLPLQACGSEQTQYANCVQIGTEEQMVGWDESDRYSVQRGVEQMCASLVEQCEKEPKSEFCIAFADKYPAE